MRPQRVDGELARVLTTYQDRYIRDWPRVFAGVDFPALRDQVSRIRGAAVDDLPGLADRFEDEVTSRGVTVHRADDASHACSIVGDICRRRGARLAVKSKSMTTEEIGLNQRLAAGGVRCVETDLGEWIVQLAGERPSHMVMPALHMNRRDVAGVMSRALGRDVPADDIDHMVKLARQELRQEFLAADVGITGANMLAADRGMAVIVTNEGNGRLVVTMPPVHVVVAGYEKLIPSLASVPAVLRALTRSATGQAITSYVTMVGAPAGGGSALLRGIDADLEMHLVLVDDGRLKAASGPMAPALKCIRCGSCANVCPVYSQVGGHVMAGALAGPIGVLSGAVLRGRPARAQDLCLGCGRCGDVCPADVGVPDLMLEARRMGPAPAPERAALRLALPRRRLVDAAAGALRVAGRATGGRGIALPGGRRVPAVAPRQFSRLAPRLDPGGGPVVALYTGCVVEYVYPGIGQAAWDLLRRSGYSVVYPHGQVCCGAPMLYGGDREGAARQLRAAARAILETAPRHVITPCPTCTWFLRELAPQLGGGEETRTVAAMTLDFTEAARELLSPPGGDPRTSWPVTYHDSCHLRWKLGVSDGPRDLLRALPGADYREMDGADRCCGFAGSYAFRQPTISRALLSAKLDRCQAAAGTVALACPGCLMHLEAGARDRELDLEFEHLASILARPGPPGCRIDPGIVESRGREDGKE